MLMVKAGETRGLDWSMLILIDLHFPIISRFSTDVGGADNVFCSRIAFLKHYCLQLMCAVTKSGRHGISFCIWTPPDAHGFFTFLY
jgi:hypothetical protein